MERLRKTRAWLYKTVRCAFETALGIAMLILIAAILVTLIGGLVITFLLGWRAILVLALTVLVLIILCTLLTVAMFYVLKRIEEETEKENLEI